jgi:hypothetical protein
VEIVAAFDSEEAAAADLKRREADREDLADSFWVEDVELTASVHAH